MKALVGQSCSTLFIPRDCSPQAALSMGFPRQEYWSELSFLSQGIFPVQELNPHIWQEDSFPTESQGSPHLFKGYLLSECSMLNSSKEMAKNKV